MNKPTQKQLQQKIVIDSLGSYLTVGKLSKEDLQVLVCLLADDLRDLAKLVGGEVRKPRKEIRP